MVWCGVEWGGTGCGVVWGSVWGMGCSVVWAVWWCGMG